MIERSLTLFVYFVLVSSGPVMAQGSTLSGKALQGVGFVECDRLLELNDQNFDLGVFHQWYLGFWVAENMHRAEAGNAPKDLSTSLTSYAVLSGFFVEQCKRNSNDTLFNAMAGFFESLPDAE